MNETKKQDFQCPYGCKTASGRQAKSCQSQSKWLAHLMEFHKDQLRIVIETPPNQMAGTGGTRHVLCALPTDGV